MRRTLFPIILSIAGILLASFTFSGKAQTGSPVSPDGLPMPEALAGFPGVSTEWWAAAQAKLSQELGKELDLITNPGWSAVGEAAGNGFGQSVASAGDVNGDGYTDLVVGAPYVNSDVGKAYIYLGSAGGPSTSPGWSAVGEAQGDRFGIRVASAGDVNGDGYSDVAVGADDYNSVGKVYVYHGSAGGLSLNSNWSDVGEAASNAFGQSLASAGDVNGDGYTDLAVGAPYYNSSVGKAYVYHGSAGGLSLTPDWSAVGEAAPNWFGFPVAAAGDVNGDGYDDVAVGAYGHNGSRGKAYVYYGSAGGLSITSDWYAVGEAAGIAFGGSMASAGDVNGDGYTDLAIGAPWHNTFTGKAYVYHGSAGGLGASPDWSAVGEAVNDEFSYSVASAGDMNADGFADLVVGSPYYNSSVGKAYVYHGSASGLSLPPDWSAVGEATPNWFGFPVASAGDVNGDGYADMAVGAYGNNNSTGKAYVYHGPVSYINVYLPVIRRAN